MSAATGDPLRVAASMWSVPPAEREAVVRRLAAAGLRRWHWDHSDGSLGPAGGFGPDEAARITRATRLAAEAHLMVADPLAVLAAWTWCDTVVVHVEADRWADAVAGVRSAGRAAAVAIAPSTPLDAVTDLDPDVGVLVMSVAPGHAGTTFVPETFDRVAALRGRTPIGVDGGMTLPLARECIAQGATWIVSGTDLCGCSDPRRWLADLGAATGDEPGPAVAR